MERLMKSIAGWVAGVVLAMAIAMPGLAQPPTTVRVVGTIEAIDGPMLTVKSRQGEVKINVTSDVTVFGVEKRNMADIKPGLFVGVGGVPMSDGSQKAIRVQIFAPGEKPNPGFRPWEGAPQGTMTNADVDSSVASASGRELLLKYKDGEKKIVVAPDAQITATIHGDKSELKPGAAIAIARAVKKPDGTLEAARINVGRGGVVPQ
jgi:hypothetical protein